jgi:hypothetical protein
MDFQYAFRQAYQDRLEDAGFIQYRPADGFGGFKARRANRGFPVQWLRPILAAILNLLTK